MVEDTNFIVISDMIVEGDHEKFAAIAARLDGPAFVLLNSRGGVLIEGLMIGEIIRAKGYTTVVLNDNRCASTCSLIWLAGKTRYSGSTARIGFHAAYTGEGDQARESGAGNAVVGAYLTKLNLPYRAVMFATSAPPDAISWLTPVKAARVGIEYDMLPDDPAPELAVPALVAAPAETAGSPLEQRIRRLVVAYYAAWSGSGAEVAGLAPFYGRNVVLYGADAPLSKVLAEKRTFSRRWPVRQYTGRPDSVYVRCAETCAVSGVVEWTVTSTERGVRSVGAANFVLRIAPGTGSMGGVIVSENGAALSKRIEPLGMF